MRRLVAVRQATPHARGRTLGGNWQGAFSLSLYAVTFSIAYVMVPIGPGALILSTLVQIGMLAWAVFKGNQPS